MGAERTSTDGKLPLQARAQVSLERLSEWAGGPAGSRAQAAVVWGGFALLAAVFLWSVARFGVNVPVYDEWQDTVPLLSDPGKLSAARLWAPHNEHRIPLPRLWLLAVLGYVGQRFPRGDARQCRSPRCWDGARALDRVPVARGAQPPHRPVPAPVLPQIQFVSSAVLSLALLSLVLLGHFDAGGVPSLRTGVLLTAVTAALPLCGSNGAAVALPPALWLFYLGCRALWVGRGRPAEARRAMPAAAGGALALSTVVLYLLALPPRILPDKNFMATLIAARQFVLMAQGVPGEGFTLAEACLLLAALALTLFVGGGRRPALLPAAAALAAVGIALLPVEVTVAGASEGYLASVTSVTRHLFPALLLPGLTCVLRRAALAVLPTAPPDGSALRFAGVAAALIGVAVLAIAIGGGEALYAASTA